MHKFLGDYPSDRHGGYTQDIQGVTHDHVNWFFTQSSSLWKFPVSYDLNTYARSAEPARGILRVGIPGVLKDEGYNHFGDLDHFSGHLFVPMEGREPPIVAVFRASNLRYVGMFELMHYRGVGDLTLIAQKQAPWCAIEQKKGTLWTSDGVLSNRRILGYRIDLEALNQGQIAGRHISFRQLHFPAQIQAMQGGAFSADGRQLYLCHGYLKDCVESQCGIKVFDWHSGNLIEASTNGSGTFNFEFHQSDWQEAEGITFWDLDDGRAPGIRGQVHALMLENDILSEDDLYFKHYRRI